MGSRSAGTSRLISNTTPRSVVSSGTSSDALTRYSTPPETVWTGPPISGGDSSGVPNSAVASGPTLPSPNGSAFDDPFEEGTAGGGTSASAAPAPGYSPCFDPCAAAGADGMSMPCDGAVSGGGAVAGGAMMPGTMMSDNMNTHPAPDPGKNLFSAPDNPADDTHLLGKWTLMNFSLFFGVQGFQGPVDEKQGSNFGFHEGLNWAVPLFEGWGISHQSGLAAVQSDLTGGTFTNSFRNQFFLTSGFYHRPLTGTGLQFGGVADFMHDDWYVKMDLDQLRAEISYVGQVHEVGYLTMISTAADSKTSPITGNTIEWQSINQNLFFYRRRLHGIGQGRIWAGFTGNGDGIVGGDGTSALTTHWSFNSNFNVTIPRQNFDKSSNSTDVESWGLSFNLVWNPGYMNPRSALNPFRALFDVADNTVMLVKQNGK